MKKLNPMQRRFVEEYKIDLNGTQAAIRAGYSPKTAGCQAFDLLKKPEIQAAIAEAQKRCCDATDISAEKVLRELALIAFARVSDIYDVGSDGTVKLKSMDEMSEHGKALISDITITNRTTDFGETQTVRVKLADRTKPLELLGKRLALFTEKVDVSGDVDITAILAAARKRSGKE